MDKIKSAITVGCDAGPAIHLDELGCLELLKDFQEILLPNTDEFVKSPKCRLNVIPAKAGIQLFQPDMDSRFRGSDAICDFLRGCHF